MHQPQLGRRKGVNQSGRKPGRKVPLPVFDQDSAGVLYGGLISGDAANLAGGLGKTAERKHLARVLPPWSATSIQITQTNALILIAFERSEPMIKAKRSSLRTSSGAAFLLFALGSFSTPLSAKGQTGTLHLTITDATTGEPVPARVGIQGVDGAYHVAKDALLVGGDCDMSDQGAGYVDLASTLAGFSDRIDNPYTKSTQFYSNGKSVVQLPTGPVTITVFRGPEYKVSVNTVEIQAAETVQHTIELTRWINMPQKGWYSADDHLHIPRPVTELNPYISKMMQAEDIHVANLLQMGKVKNFTIALQHAHGPDSYYQEGNYILAAGQENPRTHFLGHTITLGAATALHNPEKYLIYRLL